MVILAVIAGLWVFLHAPARLHDQRDPDCQKFKDMMGHSKHTTDKIRLEYVPNADDLKKWASTMQRDAAQITGESELAQQASILANDSKELDKLFLEAQSDGSPDVEDSRPGWMTNYNRISADVTIALAAFKFHCPGMEV